ncbi:MAG: hypothetical protein K1X50_03300 [Candidatus Promineofilum sp.]|nr:hypothetical protein [Promineifilum sp.]MCW5864682.1 hypothetical protein [Anaerolineae bacterium]
MTNQPAPASLPTIRYALLAAAPRLLRPFSLALSLGYGHYYTPTSLSRNRGLPQAHLNRLTAWHALQPPRGSTPLGRRRALALHLGLLHIAGFIDLTAPLLRITPTAARWLRAPFNEQARILRWAFDAAAAWAALSRRFQLGAVLTPDLLAWAGQYVTRLTAEPPPTARAARLRVGNDAWRVRLFPDSPTGPLFDLVQAGHWQALTRNGGRLALTRLPATRRLLAGNSAR